MTRKLFLAGLTALALLAQSNVIHAAEPSPSPILDRIATRGELRVGMTADQPPLNVRNRDGKVIGMEVDLASLLANALGVKLEIVETPFAELLPALKSGRIDLVMSGMTATLQRNREAAFVGPYYISGKSLLTKSSTLAAARDAAAINQEDLRVAALAGSTSQAFVELVAPKARLRRTKDYHEAVAALLGDEVDLLVADAPICVLTILRNPDAGLVTLEKPFTIEPIGIAVPPGDPLLVNLLENYLAALDATGALDALVLKWFRDGAWLAQLP